MGPGGPGVPAGSWGPGSPAGPVGPGGPGGLGGPGGPGSPGVRGLAPGEACAVAAPAGQTLAELATVPPEWLRVGHVLQRCADAAPRAVAAPAAAEAAPEAGPPRAPWIFVQPGDALWLRIQCSRASLWAWVRCCASISRRISGARRCRSSWSCASKAEGFFGPAGRRWPPAERWPCGRRAAALLALLRFGAPALATAGPFAGPFAAGGARRMLAMLAAHRMLAQRSAAGHAADSPRGLPKSVASVGGIVSVGLGAMPVQPGALRSGSRRARRRWWRCRSRRRRWRAATRRCTWRRA